MTKREKLDGATFCAIMLGCCFENLAIVGCVIAVAGVLQFIKYKML